MSPRGKHRRRSLVVILSLATACVLVSGFALTDIPLNCCLRLVGGPTFSWKRQSVQAFAPPRTEKGEVPRSPAPGQDVHLHLPGIRLPPTHAAADSGLRDEATVIGVCAGGRARAYVIDMMAGPAHHVVNDVLGNCPVSVTYCDLTGCARAFTSDSRGQPLDMDVGGWIKDGLALQVGGMDYAQATGAPLDGAAAPFPYEELPHELVKWEDWYREHPDTDVYLGVSTPTVVCAPGG